MSQPPPWSPYGQNPQGQYPYQPSYRSVNGGLILTLGILGVLLCNFLGPVALMMGSSAVAAIDRGEANPNERGSASAGRIMGIIGTVFLVIGVFFWVALLANPTFREAFSKGYAKGYRQSQPQNKPEEFPPFPDSPPSNMPAPTPPQPTVPQPQ